MSKIAVCVLIINVENYTFLSVSLKDDHTDFNLPGGKVEFGENLTSTGIREVKEEGSGLRNRRNKEGYSN